MSLRAPLLPLTLLVLGCLLGASSARAHCQVPCGIYDDQMRIQLIREDMTTVEKAMRQVREIGAEGKPNWNQLVRWVTNKEEHASRIQETVTQYFMAQRIKPAPAGDRKAQREYAERLQTLHELLVTAMKMKQTTDEAHVEHGRELVDRFVKQYFSEADAKHLLMHHEK